MKFMIYFITFTMFLFINNISLQNLKTISKTLGPQCIPGNSGSNIGCKVGYEFNNGLCYLKCDTGFSRQEMTCYKNCPDDMTDSGNVCLKSPSYSRGVGYQPWDRLRCDYSNWGIGCELFGNLFYPKCKTGYSPSIYNICVMTCPLDLFIQDAGNSCVKKYYTTDIAKTPCKIK